jgi:hypothetical protein
MRRHPHSAVFAVILVLAGCASRSSQVGMESMMRPTAVPSPSADLVALRGSFVKLTNLPCHRSDYFVGGETVIFLGSDGSATTIGTQSADWTGLPADPPRAPLGQCRQVAPFEVDLPVAERYVVVINDGRLAPVTLSQLSAEGMRHTFRLAS